MRAACCEDATRMPPGCCQDATAGQLNAPLLVALARDTERQKSQCSAQNFANTAWAYATAEQSDAPLLVALAKDTERQICQCSAQSFANTAWA